MLDETDKYEMIVVESLIFPDSLPMVIVEELISYQSDDTIVNPVDGLEIFLSSSNDTVILKDYDSAGYYTCYNQEISLCPDSLYDIWFEYKDHTISSSTYIPHKPQNVEMTESEISLERILEGEWGMPNMEEIEINWDNDDNEYYFLFFEYLEDEPDIVNENIGDIDDLPTQITTQILTSNTFEVRSMMFAFFGTYRIVLFHVTNDYAEMFEQISQTSADLTNPLTNINNAWGIFAGLNSDTLFFEVKELTK
jgi:hypothetical protein